MAKFGEIASDQRLEAEGIWERYPDTDMEFLIGSITNPRYEAAVRAVRKKTRGKTSDEMSEREMKDLLAGAIAGNLLLGWRGVEADDSTPENRKELPFTVTGAVERLRDPQLHMWYDWILTKARDGDRFRKANLAEVVGN